jgi:hypothetical protein
MDIRSIGSAAYLDGVLSSAGAGGAASPGIEGTKVAKL